MMEVETIYENAESCEIRTPSGRTQAKPQKRRRRCSVVLSVCLGLLCVLLLVFITVRSISHEHIVEELNLNISGSQRDHTDLKTEKERLQVNFSTLSLKNLELETKVTNLTAEKKHLLENIESLNRKNQELETQLKKSYEQGIFVSTELKSWSESRRFCMGRGGDLVIIDSEEKQRFITSLVHERIWIGLTDIDEEGNMRWVNNSTLKQGFWEFNEPNNVNGNEDCAELNPSKLVLNNWNDVPCSDQRKCVCENQRCQSL